jgi:hypothetical protein
VEFTAGKLTLWSGRLLAAAWASWWIFFGVASGIGEKLTPLGVLIHTAVPGLFFGLVLILAWKWPAAGGFLLLLMGPFVAVAYPMLMFRNRPIRWDWYEFILVTMALPPFLAGIMLITHWWSGRSRVA